VSAAASAEDANKKLRLLTFGSFVIAEERTRCGSLWFQGNSTAGVEGIAAEGERSYFVTSERAHEPSECLYLLRQYVKRWGCEDAIRFLKQSRTAGQLEDIRVLKFRRIRRVRVLAMLVFAFLCELEYYCEQRLCQWSSIPMPRSCIIDSIKALC